MSAGDVTVIATLSIQNSANAPIIRAGEACDGWINTADHTARDALPTAITTLGTLVRTRSDGVVWEVVSVGPVVYAAWSGSGGVTSFATRIGAIVPATNDYTDLQIQNTSSVAGTGVKGALNTLFSSIGAVSTTVSGLVTGVSTVFGRAGAVVAAAGDYAASKVNNDSLTVAGAHVDSALDNLKAAIAAVALTSGVTGVFGRTGAVVAVAGDYSASKITNDSATVPGAEVSNALDNLKSIIGVLVIANIAALIVTNVTGITNGTLAQVVVPDDTYELVVSPSAAIIAATDGVNIVQPTTPNTVRWVRKGTAYSFVSAWYINATTGNDANDGSSGNPLKTLVELTTRLCPGGATRLIYQNVAVNIASGTYTAPAVLLSVSGPFTVTIACAFSSSAGITLSAATNAVGGITTVGSGTRAQVTTAATGPFASLQLLRCTSGSHVGATAYVLDLVTTQNAFTTPFKDASGNSVAMAPGDVVVIDTPLVDIDHLDIETHGGASVVVQYLGTLTTKACQLKLNPGDLDTITLSLCRGAFVTRYSIGGHFANCAGSWFSSAGFLTYQGTLFCSKASVWEYCSVEFRGADVLWGGGSFTLFANDYLNFYAANFYMGLSEFNQGDPLGLEVEQCTAASATALIQLLGFAQMTMQAFTPGNTVWGVTGGTGPVCAAFALERGSNVYLQQATPPTVPCTVQIRLDGSAIAKDYAHLPIVIPWAQSAFMWNAKSASAEVYSAGLTDVVAAVSPFAFGTPAPGMYDAQAYLSVNTAATAGLIAVFVTYTDPSGNSQKQQVTAWLDASVTGPSDGSIIIRSSGTTAILYSVESEPTHTFTKGSLSYSLSLLVERKSSV